MKKVILFLIIFFVLNSSYASAATLYFRSDNHTVNGYNGFSLGEEISDSYTSISVPNHQFRWARWHFQFAIRHADGTEDDLGGPSPFAHMYYTGGDRMTSLTWTCPETDLDVTDALRVRVFITGTTCAGYKGPVYAQFISDQLGWIKLNESTWTITFWYAAFQNNSYFRWGNNAVNSRIINVSKESYEDIGLGINSGSKIIKIGTLTDLTGHSLRIRKNGTTYAIPLVETDDLSASPIRIFDGSSIKALSKVE